MRSLSDGKLEHLTKCRGKHFYAKGGCRARRKVSL